MNTHNDITKPFWVIPQQKHYGQLSEGNQVSSKFDFETFASESELKARLIELNIKYETIEELTRPR